MHITFVLDPARITRWQAEAISRCLAYPGWSGSILMREGPPRPSGLDLVYGLERLIYKLPDDGAMQTVASADLGLPLAKDRPDLVADLMVDLVGNGPVRNSLRLTCNQAPLELGAVNAILASQSPVLALTAYVDGEGTELASWPVAVEEPDVLSRGVGYVMGRAVQMTEMACQQIAAGALMRTIVLPTASGSPKIRTRPPLKLFLRTLRQRLADRLNRRSRERARWITAWRPRTSGANELPLIKGVRFEILPDDGRRFYADPFVVSRNGSTVLFVEDFPFATGRGVISAVELGPDGPIGQPRPVLEQDCHLSYPFLFEDGGQLYMVPETSERRTVELWRCTAFPDRWEREAVLIDNVDLGDATLIKLSGGWFLFGASRDRWCSSWDALDLWSAPELLGPWSRVGDGPVVVDVDLARPAGQILEVAGRLIRPFQSSGSSYGAGLGFAEIDRCDLRGFAQTPKARIFPARPYQGLHTYNRTADFEVIDLFGTGRAVSVVP